MTIRTSDDLISPHDLHSLLALDYGTGTLTWLPRDTHQFLTPAYGRAWNRRYAGSPALHKIGNHGYRCGTIWQRSYLAHRVVWAMIMGEWPENEIDHINRIRTDNAPANLQDVTHQKNTQNAKLRSDNTSGHVGVHQRTDTGKWMAYIRTEGRLKSLGSFAEFDMAVAARMEAQRGLGYRDDHGMASL